jgi:hypothetical protein
LTNVVNILSFGADPTGRKDSYKPIQDAINAAITTDATVSIPKGNYTLSRGLLLINWDGTKYIQHGVNIIGDGNWWKGGCVLNFTHKNGFGIGIQLGKGPTIKGVKIVGRFNPPTENFYKLSIDEYNDPTIVSKWLAPYAGLVIDPFTNNETENDWGKDGYEGYGKYYGGQGQTSSGSTGLILEDLIFSNWDGCVVPSPNGYTQNAELIRGRRIQVANCRVGLANTQSQEKTNTFQHIGSWADVHTLFAKRWGAGTPGVYHISDVNIAGRVNQFIDHEEGGYFGSHFERIFCESMGRFGRLNSEKGATVEKSEIGFAYPEETGYWQQKCIESTGVTFRDCSIRYYGKNVPVTLSGRSHYDNCKFEAQPYLGSMYEMDRMPTFSTQSPIYEQGTYKLISPFGRKTLIDSTNIDSLEYSHEVNYSLPYCQMLLGVFSDLNLPSSPLLKDGLPIIGDVTGFIGVLKNGEVTFPVREYTPVSQRLWVIHPLWHHHFSGMTKGKRISSVIGKMPKVGMCIASPSSNNGYSYSRWNYVVEVGTDWAECLYPFFSEKEDVFSTAKEVNVNVRHGNADLSKVKFILGDRFNGKICIKSGDINNAKFN